MSKEAKKGYGVHKTTAAIHKFIHTSHTKGQNITKQQSLAAAHLAGFSVVDRTHHGSQILLLFL